MIKPKKIPTADELQAVKRRVDEAEQQINLLIDRHAHPETIAEAIDWMITLQRQRQRIIKHRESGASA